MTSVIYLSYGYYFYEIFVKYAVEEKYLMSVFPSLLALGSGHRSRHIVLLDDQDHLSS